MLLPSDLTPPLYGPVQLQHAAREPATVPSHDPADPSPWPCSTVRLSSPAPVHHMRGIEPLPPQDRPTLTIRGSIVLRQNPCLIFSRKPPPPRPVRSRTPIRCYVQVITSHRHRNLRLTRPIKSGKNTNGVSHSSLTHRGHGILGNHTDKGAADQSPRSDLFGPAPGQPDPA